MSASFPENIPGFHQVRHHDKDERRRFLKLAVETFIGDPVIRHLAGVSGNVQDDEAWRRVWKFLNMIVNLYDRRGWIVRNDNWSAVAVVSVPNNKPGLIEIMAFLRAVAFHFGWRGISRLLVAFFRQRSVNKRFVKLSGLKRLFRIKLVAVAKEARGRGFGARLIMPIFMMAKKFEAGVYFEVNNKQSHDFWRRFGCRHFLPIDLSDADGQPLKQEAWAAQPDEIKWPK